MRKLLYQSRRNFLKNAAVLTGGLLVGFHLPAPGQQKAPEGPPPLPPADPNAYLHIAADGTVTIIVAYAEMGQGTLTAMAQLIGEELDVDWKKIVTEAAPMDIKKYGHPTAKVLMTGGSLSTVVEWERMRKVGAAVRATLVTAAARKWGVPEGSLKTSDGYVWNAKGQKLSYGALAGAAALLPLPQNPKLKDPKEFKMIGKRMKRLDTPDKTNGRAKFGLDVQLPGMLVAVVARCPYFGGKVKSFNADKARALPGVKAVVPVPLGVAVVATGFWIARKGSQLLEIEWDGGPNAGLDSRQQVADFRALLDKPGLVAINKGDVVNTPGAVQTFEAEFVFPYMAHATMEPMNVTVDAKADGCDIYIGSQGQTVDQMAVAGVLKLKPEQVRLHNQLLGGGFGRRGTLDGHIALEGAIISKAVSAPVKTIWTREDDTRGGYYRSLSVHRIKTGLDKDGNLNTWFLHMVTQSYVFQTPMEKGFVKDGVDSSSVAGSTDIIYNVPNLRAEWTRAPDTVPTLWQRGNSHLYTGYIKETMMDVMAKKVGVNPYEYRLRHLRGNEIYNKMLKLLTEKGGWGKPLPKGHAQGMAIHPAFSSTIAMMAEVSLTDAGAINIHKITAVIDCGTAVNPANVEAQVQGSVIFYLSTMLYSNITFKDGQVEQSNFDDYRVARMHQSPPVDVHVVSYQPKIGGVGEVPVGVVPACIANGVFALTGNHIKSFPFPEDVRKI